MSEREGFRSVPFGLESSGAISPRALGFVNCVGRYLVTAPGAGFPADDEIPRGNAVGFRAFMLGALSAECARGNARIALKISREILSDSTRVLY
jgi:hypothetical protein